MEVNKEVKINDMQKIRETLTLLGDKPSLDLDTKTLSCHNREFKFNSDYELIEVVNK